MLRTGTRFLKNFQDAPRESAIFDEEDNEILRMLRTGARFSAKNRILRAGRRFFQNFQDAPHGSAISFNDRSQSVLV